MHRVGNGIVENLPRTMDRRPCLLQMRRPGRRRNAPCRRPLKRNIVGCRSRRCSDGRRGCTSEQMAQVWAPRQELHQRRFGRCLLLSSVVLSLTRWPGERRGDSAAPPNDYRRSAVRGQGQGLRKGVVFLSSWQTRRHLMRWQTIDCRETRPLNVRDPPSHLSHSDEF